MIEILNLELVILLECPNIKIILQKVTFQIALKKFLVLRELKTLCRGHVLSDLKGEEIFGTFYEKKLQKTNQKRFRVEKVIKRKGDKLYVKQKGYDSSFNSRIDKN